MTSTHQLVKRGPIPCTTTTTVRSNCGKVIKTVKEGLVEPSDFLPLVLPPGLSPTQKEIWGPLKWEEFHKKTSSGETIDRLRIWVDLFLRTLPCMECAKHGVLIFREIPLKEGEDPFEWGVRFHNAVNQLLGKPEMTLAQAKEIWLD